jgi:LAS superfamily LD-carboxypeptidase LdcB
VPLLSAAPATPASGSATPDLCLVTRDRGVPATYIPPDLVQLSQGPTVGPAVLLRTDAANALLRLLDGATAQKVHLIAISGFRSYELQQQTLAQEIKQYGPQKAHSEVADPGHSEHQLGVAVDVAAARDPTNLDQSFGGTPEGRWLAANAVSFGFVISYPIGKETVTGYAYEPWHIRYVGLPLAQSIAASGQTLTEYLPAHGLGACDQDGAAG